jgi:phosphatidylglycerol:prolipoprotein diacylglycerol transferase
LDVGPAAIQLPGLILLLGFWFSLSLAGRRARAAGLSEDMISGVGMTALLVGLAGARLGYVALHWDAYQGDWKGVLALVGGAFSTPAGLLVGLGAGALYLRRYRPPAAVLLDVLAPSLALMLACISLADLSRGSAYGAVSDLPWAIELWGARRHPTQVYELLAALAALGLSALCARRGRWFDGFFFLSFSCSYGAARSFLDAFRAGLWLLPGGLRAMQVIGLGSVLVSSWLMSRQVLTTDSARTASDTDYTD